MKMYSKEGQVLIDVSSKLTREGDDLIMKGKLMNAYSMPIVVRPEEAWALLSILPFKIMCYLPLFMFKGWLKSRQMAKEAAKEKMRASSA